MQILTINLDDLLLEQLTLQLPARFYNTSTLSDAISYIHREDFHHIILTPPQATEQQHLLSTLIGLTPVYTRIIVISATTNMEQICAWEEMGVELILPCSASNLVPRVATLLDRK